MAMSGIKVKGTVMGGLSKGDAIGLFVLMIYTAFSGFAFGFIEYEFFTQWNTARYAGLDPTWILGQFNWMCVMMFVVAAIPMLMLITLAILQGNKKRAMFYAIFAPLMILVWILVQDFTAHLLYGADPAGDWNDWIFAAYFQYSPNHWMPSWYLLIIIIGMIMIIWFSFVYARRKGIIHKVTS